MSYQTMRQTLLSHIFPNYNEVFFNLFAQSAQNTTAMAALLLEAITTDSDHDQKQLFVQISRLRVKSQEITHQVFTESGQAFVSPFERNDMCLLVQSIDKVAGYINISARRINLYNLTRITPPIKELAGLIVEITNELEKAVNGMSNLKDTQFIIDTCNNIKSLEHYADKVYNTAVANLLVDEPIAIELIKYNEILLALETTTDKCEHVTNVIESIVIKNS